MRRSFHKSYTELYAFALCDQIDSEAAKEAAVTGQVHRDAEGAGSTASTLAEIIV